MKKTIIIASLAVLVTAAALTTFALGGAGKFGGVRVNADPNEYSIDLDVESTVETVGDGVYTICGTTPRGAKVGVVGYDNSEAHFAFKEASFIDLRLYGYEELKGVGADQFSHIIGFALYFMGGSVDFDGGSTKIEDIEPGEDYEVSITPDDLPEFHTEGSVTIASLTIYYTC